MKIIENKKTGQRFEIADGALYPKAAYREITLKVEQKEEPKVNPEPLSKLRLSRKAKDQMNQKKNRLKRLKSANLARSLKAKRQLNKNLL